MTRSAYPARRTFRRWVAAAVSALLMAGGLTAMSATSAAAVDTIEFVNAATDNYKTWVEDRNVPPGAPPRTDERTSFLFSTIKVGATTYYVPQSRLNEITSSGQANAEATGMPLATAVGGATVAYLYWSKPGTTSNVFRLFTSGVFGPWFGINRSTFVEAPHTPVQLTFTLKNTGGTTIASSSVHYTYDAQIASLPESSPEWHGPLGRFYLGSAGDLTKPTPLNWPSKTAVSQTNTGSAHQTAISVVPDQATTLYVSNLDIAGIPVPRFSDFDNGVVQWSLAWAPAGAGRPATTTGDVTTTWRPITVTLPAGTYSLTATGECDRYCHYNYVDHPLSNTAVTITSEAPPAGAPRKPDALVRAAGGSYIGGNIYNGSSGTIVSSGQLLTVDAVAGTTTTFDLQIQNDGTATDSFTVQGTPTTGWTGFTHVLTYDGDDVTPSFASGVSVPDVSPGATRQLTMAVTPAAGTTVGTSATYNLHVIATGSNPVLKDVLGVKVNVIAGDPEDPDGTITGSTPEIQGTLAVGSTLSLLMDTWLPSPVSLKYQWYNNGKRISGADDPTYKLPSSASADTISVNVKGSKPGFASVTKTSNSVVIQKYISKAPKLTIKGTPRVGNTLTASTSGSWSTTPTTRTYQWMRDGAQIPGATSKTYELTEDDGVHTISVWLTGEKAGFSAKVVKSAGVLALKYFLAVDPDIFYEYPGSAALGSYLWVWITPWGPDPDYWTYQWTRDGKPIKGATKERYTLTLADSQKSINVILTGHKYGYVTASEPTISPIEVGRYFKKVPTIKAVLDGECLDFTKSGSFYPAASSQQLQWFRDGEPMPGWEDPVDYESGLMHPCIDNEEWEGHEFTAVLSAERVGYTEAKLQTKPVRFAGAIELVTEPTVTGTPTVGQTLTLSKGSWTPSGLTYRYQWVNELGELLSAKSSYKVKASDAGSAIWAYVWVTRTGYYPNAWGTEDYYIP